MSSVRPHSLHPDDLVSSTLARAWTIPAHWYSAADIHAFELEQIFAPAWQLLGSAPLTSTGEYIAGEIAGVPAFAVRDRDGTLRAFHNVCRHRAGPVVRGRGQCDLLRCRYHGWLYRLDGTLHTAPELGDAQNFDISAQRLPPLETHHATPLVFVRRTAQRAPTFDLAGALQEIERRIAPLRLTELAFVRQVRYVVPCNWKVYVDNYLEGYHLPLVHPSLTKVLDYRDYRTELFDGYSLQHSPIRTSAGAYTQGDAFYYFLFPNVMLNILPGRLQTNVVLPRGPDACEVVFDYYYADEGVDPAAREAKIDADIRFADEVQLEDVGICGEVQRGLASGSWQRGRLSVRREQGVHHFHEMLRGACRTALNFD